MAGRFGGLLSGKGLQCGGINVWHFRNALLCTSDATPLTNINHTDQVLRNSHGPALTYLLASMASAIRQANSNMKLAAVTAVTPVGS
jgi:hypothetical protein